MTSKRPPLALISLLLVSACTPKLMTGYYDKVQASSALSPHWVQASPANILTPTAVWSSSNSPLLTAQKLQFFSDGNCSHPAGPPVDLGSTTQQSYLFTGVDGGIYTFQVISILNDGFQNSSSCSNPISLVTTLPNATSLLWSQASPVNANQATLSWMKSTSPILYDQKIQFFSDGFCTVSFGSLIDLSSSSIHTKVFQASNGTYSYKITSLDSAGNSSTSSCSNAIVIDDLASASLSSFTAIPASIPADGTSTATINVTLLDSQSLPVSGKFVSVSSSRGSIDTITAATAMTDASGKAVFTLKSNKIGSPTFSVSVASDSVTLTQVGHVTLLGVGAVPQTDYQAWLATNGQTSGSNLIPTSSFKDLTQASSTNNGTLYNFSYTSASGWAGDGSLLTQGALGPNRLVFNGTSSYIDLGAGIHLSPSLSFEIWIRPENPTVSGSVILSTADSSNKGFTLSQLSDGSGKIVLNPAGVFPVYSQTVLALSPLIYWKLNEVSGTTINDYSGNGYSGTYAPNSGTVSQGQPSLLTNYDPSVAFSGTGYATAYSNTTLTGPSIFSIEVWFRTTTTSGGNLVGLNNAQDNGGGMFDHQLYMSNSGTMNFYMWTGTTSTVTSTSALNDGLPHHAVGTLSSAGQLLYIDGVLVASSGNTVGQTNSGFYFRAGGFRDSYWQGTLAHAAFYTQALTQAQIQAHYLAGTENCISQTALAQNVWNHLAGVFNSSGNTASLYLNGNQQCTIPLSGINYSGSSSDLMVGSSPSQTNFWSGAIASIKTYAQALTSSLIQQNYAATAATFDIQKLGAPSPLMWLRADAIQGLSDGAPLSTWPDLSPNGNNATQGSAGNQPVWKKNILNGYPVVRFDGTSSFMNGPNAFPVGSDYTIIACLNPSVLGPTNNIFSGLNRRAFFLYNGYLDVQHFNSRSTPSTNSLSQNVPAVVSVTFENSNLTVSNFINGFTAGSSTISAANSDNTIEIGTIQGGSYYFEGDIAEIFLFGSSLSNYDRILIETYLNAKYGVY